MPCNPHCLSIFLQAAKTKLVQRMGNSSILNKKIPKMVRWISGLFTFKLLFKKIQVLKPIIFWRYVFVVVLFSLTFSYSMYNLSNPSTWCVTRTQPTNGHAYGPRWWITKSGPYFHFLWCDLWWKLQTILRKIILFLELYSGTIILLLND